MGAQAENPKAKARQKREVDASQKEAYYEVPDGQRCTRFGQTRACSHSHRCGDCWFDAGFSPVKQAEVKVAPPGWIHMEIAVEDGISLLASLIHQRQTVKSGTDGFPGRAITSHHTGRLMPRPFENHVFELRPGAQRGHIPNFRIDEFDFSARWGEHIGYCGYQSRPVKGKEWIRIMQRCLESLTLR